MMAKSIKPGPASSLRHNPPNLFQCKERTYMFFLIKLFLSFLHIGVKLIPPTLGGRRH